jgi:hypothetical protein
MNNGAKKMDVVAYMFAVDVVSLEQCQSSTDMGFPCATSFCLHLKLRVVLTAHNSLLGRFQDDQGQGCLFRKVGISAIEGNGKFSYSLKLKCPSHNVDGHGSVGLHQD